MVTRTFARHLSHMRDTTRPFAVASLPPSTFGRATSPVITIRGRVSHVLVPRDLWPVRPCSLFSFTRPLFALHTGVSGKELFSYSPAHSPAAQEFSPPTWLIYLTERPQPSTTATDDSLSGSSDTIRRSCIAISPGDCNRQPPPRTTHCPAHLTSFVAGSSRMSGSISSSPTTSVTALQLHYDGVSHLPLQVSEQ